MNLSIEKRTIKAMIGIYCKKHHSIDSHCSECNELLEYAYRRIDHCRFSEKKPACNSCPVHCYAPAKLEKIREVMRFSGKLMPLWHPYLSAIHLLKTKRKLPVYNLNHL